jgi:hypothetical protein
MGGAMFPSIMIGPDGVAHIVFTADPHPQLWMVALTQITVFPERPGGW